MTTNDRTVPFPDGAHRAPGVVPHLSVDERRALGKAARKVIPRSSHGVFLAAGDRPDPVALLEEQAKSRVEDLVPIRYGRMAASPFAFYRGAALIMAADLATTPQTGITVQACGDAHLANFGVYASPERRLIFDVNDFDETLPGPWEWDLKRLVASLAIAGQHRNFSAKQRRQVVQAAAETYRVQMAAFSKMKTLELWYQHMPISQVMRQLGPSMSTSARRGVDRQLEKAKTRDSSQALSKLTEVVDGTRRFISDPPLLVPLEELIDHAEADAVQASFHGLLRSYRRSLQSDRRHLLERFEFVSMARKVVGVGSVGTRAWVLLLLGRDQGDPLLLQAKEAQASVLERFTKPSAYLNQGQRVVAGQHLMQAASDIFLGWEQAMGIDGVTRDYYVRQLRDWKGSLDLETASPVGLVLYARLCGWTLARGHARSGDPVAISSYLGGTAVFDEAMVSFAEAYAEQNERDYQQFCTEIDAGRLRAIHGI